jgi:hypothetical protein
MHVDVSVFKRIISTSWFVNLYGYLWKIKLMMMMTYRIEEPCCAWRLFIVG